MLSSEFEQQRLEKQWRFYGLISSQGSSRVPAFGKVSLFSTWCNIHLNTIKFSLASETGSPSTEHQIYGLNGVLKCVSSIQHSVGFA